MAEYRLTVPDFMIIGCARCGTTWLYENLRVHPQVHFHYEKEPGHWTNGMIENTHRLMEYCDAMKGNQWQISGEATTNYALMSYESRELLKRFNPDLKLILMTRDPVDRMWSHILWYLQHLDKKYIEDDAETDEIIHEYLESNISNESRFTAIIDSWSDYEVAGRLFVGQYEHIKTQPEKLLKRIFGFLNIHDGLPISGFPVADRFMVNDNRMKVEKTKYKKILCELYADESKRLAYKIETNKIWRKENC